MFSCGGILRRSAPQNDWQGEPGKNEFIRSRLKGAFWFKIKADVKIKPEEYLCISRI
jgi:hypothetical protein